MMNEIKIIFKEGNKIRSLRGQKKDEYDVFVVLERRDGTFWINKNEIIKIEVLNDG